MRILWRLTGLIAVFSAWNTIYLSVSKNPWFNVFKHALSDLGGPRAVDSWIYNVGLIVTGALASTYATYLAKTSTSKISTYASSFIFIAGIFLALIGLFPSGTRPHVFVSTWFFIQVWMALVASTIDFLFKKQLIPGLTLLSLSIIGPLGALLVKWPSVALLEIYGIIIINAYVTVLTRKF